MRSPTLFVVSNALSLAAILQPNPGETDPPREEPAEQTQPRLTEPTAADGERTGSDENAAANGAMAADRLRDLAGVWRVEITEYDGDRIDERSGLADRSWALDGAVLIERYAFGGPGIAGETEPPPPLVVSRALDGDIWDRTTPGIDDDVLESPILDDMSDGPLADDPDNDENNDLDPTDSPLLDDMSGNPADVELRPRETPLRTATRRRSSGGASEAVPGGSEADARGLVLWGYDDSQSRFTVAWTSAESGRVGYGTGRFDDRGRLVLNDAWHGGGASPNAAVVEGSSGDRPDAAESYTIVDITSPDRQVLSVYSTSDSGEATRTAQLVYTRLPEPASR